MSVEDRDMTWFEDFHVGQSMRHSRGKTIDAWENVLFTHLTLNTAQGHFNEDEMARSEFKSRLVFGGITASLVAGLASQDCASSAIAERSIERLRLIAPVFHGDTLYAATEVLACECSIGAPGGSVRFRHIGFNQHGKQVCELERTILLPGRPGSLA